MIIVKRLSFLLIFLLLFSLMACDAPQSVSKTRSLSVSIVTDVDTYSLYMSSVKGITLKPKLEGDIDKNIQYHWSINSHTEMFDTPNGPQNELINSGEPVLFIPVAEISYVETNRFSKAIKITLIVEEKDSKSALAKSELIIEDYSGTYKVKK